MKKSQVLFLLFLLSAVLKAQTTPLFQSQFFFEDAQGNRDTLTWGTDLGANYEEYEPELGEVFLTEPFDSVFEVRATEWPYGAGIDTANPIVVPAIDNSPFPTLTCEIETSGSFYLLMSLRYPPVTITWNKADFADICRLRSFFTPIEHNLVDVDPSFDFFACTPNACLAEDSLFQFDFLPESFGCFEEGYDDIIISRQEEVLNDENVGTLYGLLYEGLSGQGVFNPCTHLNPIINDTENSSAQAESKIEIYPNPISNNFAIRNFDNIKWQTMEIFNELGQRVKRYSQNESLSSYSLEGLPRGIYFLSIKDASSKTVAIQKIVKI